MASAGVTSDGEQFDDTAVCVHKDADSKAPFVPVMAAIYACLVQML